MKIALVSPYALNVFGGVQEQALAMSRELSSRGHEVLLIAPNNSDNAEYDTPAAVERFGSLLSLPANGSKAPLTLSPRAARQANRSVDAFTPDVVHFHEPFAPLVGWSVLRSHRYPSVATFHRSGGGPAVRLTKPLLSFLARGIDRSAAVSEMAKQTMGEASGLSPRVLFNGFELNRFTQVARAVPTSPQLVTIGRLEARKGVHVAIEAVLRHNESSQEQWHLNVIGDGPERLRLEELAGGASSISFLGAVRDEVKLQVLRESSLFVAPALFGESFGMVLLEAMASEVPVVVSDIDGYRQACGGHATLFTAGSPESLEASITSALESTSADDVAGALNHARGWSMATLIDQYEGLYREAVSAFRSAK